MKLSPSSSLAKWERWVYNGNMNEVIGREVSNERGTIMVNWDKKKFRKLAKCYLKASEEKAESFFMDDLAFNTRYAGYLLLYLSDKLGVKNKALLAKININKIYE